MSRFEFKLPDIGEGVTEGEVVSWLVAVGDVVEADQDVVEVMTDKATVTIGAPKGGKVLELHGGEGDVIPVGGVLVVFELVDGGSSAGVTATASSDAGRGETRASAVGDLKDDLPGMNAADAEAAVQERPLAAPATRKLARELGVDLRTVTPSGPGGRITREDVEARARGAAAPAPGAPEAPSRPGLARASSVAPPRRAAPPPSPVASTGADRRVPIRGMRKRIYENMARSKHTAAHFTYVDEVDVGALKEVRARAKAHVAGASLTFLPFIVKAVVAGLRRNPALNCLVDDEAMEMVLRSSFDIGIAVATDSGLTVPVLRRADELSIAEIAVELERLSSEARAGKTPREDLGGSSFTITSLGRLGGLFATPVVNYPEVAILGVHEIKRRPVVRGDQIVIGDVMIVSLSFDHRIIDGHVGAAFAQDVKGYLETPDRLLVEMR